MVFRRMELEIVRLLNRIITLLHRLLDRRVTMKLHVGPEKDKRK